MTWYAQKRLENTKQNVCNNNSALLFFFFGIRHLLNEVHGNLEEFIQAWVRVRQRLLKKSKLEE